MSLADLRQQAAAADTPALPSSPAAEPAPQAQEKPQEKPNHYCLETGKYCQYSRLVTVERFFYYPGEQDENGNLVLVDQGLHPVTGQRLPPAPDTSKAPICPHCTALLGPGPDPLTGKPRERRVSACAVEYDEAGEPVIPAAIQALARRIGEA